MHVISQCLTLTKELTGLKAQDFFPNRIAISLQLVPRRAERLQQALRDRQGHLSFCGENSVGACVQKGFFRFQADGTRDDVNLWVSIPDGLDQFHGARKLRSGQDQIFGFFKAGHLSK